MQQPKKPRRAIALRYQEGQDDAPTVIATGKGLIDVHAAAQVLAHRLPEGQVLSHDLLEGSLMRCAGASDVVLVEAAPMHADVAASRIHRWTRGDWQLLPFIAHPRRWGLRGIPAASERSMPAPVSAPFADSNSSFRKPSSPSRAP